MFDLIPIYGGRHEQSRNATRRAGWRAMGSDAEIQSLLGPKVDIVASVKAPSSLRAGSTSSTNSCGAQGGAYVAAAFYMVISQIPTAIAQTATTPQIPSPTVQPSVPPATQQQPADLPPTSPNAVNTLPPVTVVAPAKKTTKPVTKGTVVTARCRTGACYRNPDGPDHSDQPLCRRDRALQGRQLGVAQIQ
jgi:hypothetical protein